MTAYCTFVTLPQETRQRFLPIILSDTVERERSPECASYAPINLVQCISWHKIILAMIEVVLSKLPQNVYLPWMFMILCHNGQLWGLKSNMFLLDTNLTLTDNASIDLVIPDYLATHNAAFTRDMIARFSITSRSSFATNVGPFVLSLIVPKQFPLEKLSPSQALRQAHENDGRLMSERHLSMP